MVIVVPRGTVEVTVDVDVGSYVLVRITCNRDMDQVPGGVTRTIVLASEGVRFIWSRRYTVLPSVRTDYSSVWVHVQMLPLHIAPVAP